MNKIYSEVYGCPSNIADYEIALGLLKRAGFETVESPHKSDLNIVFTCGVKVPTAARMVFKIQQLAKSGRPLVVAGCMPKIEQRAIEKAAPTASMLGPDSIENVVDAVARALNGEKVIYLNDLRKSKLCLPRNRKTESVGIVPISIGCLSNCSYCATKLARGRLKSYRPEEIVEEVKRFVKDGCKDIWLTAEDNGCYGLDIGTNLAQLIKEVCKVRGDFKIRVGMMNPTYIKDEKLLNGLIEAYKNEKIVKFLHLPVQSGSDRILKLMKRGYTVKDFEKIVERFRKEMPDLFLSTDVIAGFPRETEKDFQSTINLLKKIKPRKVNISKFGAKPGTEAVGMKQLPIGTINERSRILYKLVQGA